MIIIKTKTGDVLLNEKLTMKVEHNKEKAEVTVTYPYNKPRPQTIPFVLRVDYTNDAEPTRYISEGNEIAELKQTIKRLELRKEEVTIMFDNFRYMYLEMRDFIAAGEKFLSQEGQNQAVALMGRIEKETSKKLQRLEEVRKELDKLSEVNLNTTDSKSI